MRCQKTRNREADTVLRQRDQQLREANRNIRDVDSRCDRAFAQVKPLDAVRKRNARKRFSTDSSVTVH